MKHIILGKKGEIEAFNFLKAKGYKILQTNYVNVLGEIDIIAKEKEYLVFVEVKTRFSRKFGRASEAVNFYKQKKIKEVALLYLKKNNALESNVRFDVIEVYDNEINHIVNAFW